MKIGNKLSYETPERVVHVYSNSKMATAFSDANKLKMFVWDHGDV
jgi:hypothetical protein